jgi:hypothetical protein
MSRRRCLSNVLAETRFTRLPLNGICVNSDRKVMAKLRQGSYQRPQVSLRGTRALKESSLQIASPSARNDSEIEQR